MITAPATGLAIDRLGLAPALSGAALFMLAAVMLSYVAWWRAADRAAEPIATRG